MVNIIFPRRPDTYLRTYGRCLPECAALKGRRAKTATWGLINTFVYYLINLMTFSVQLLSVCLPSPSLTQLRRAQLIIFARQHQYYLCYNNVVKHQNMPCHVYVWDLVALAARHSKKRAVARRCRSVFSSSVIVMCWPVPPLLG